MPYELLWGRDSADVIQAAEDFRVALEHDLADIHDSARWSIADWEDILRECFEMSKRTWGVPLDLLQRLVVNPDEIRSTPECFAEWCGEHGPTFKWLVEDYPVIPDDKESGADWEGDEEREDTALDTLGEWAEGITQVLVLDGNYRPFSRWALEELTDPERWNRIVGAWVEEKQQDLPRYYRTVRGNFDELAVSLGKDFPAVRIPRHLLRLVMTQGAEILEPSGEPCWSCEDLMLRMVDDEMLSGLPLEPGIYVCLRSDCSCARQNKPAADVAMSFREPGGRHDVVFGWVARFRDEDHFNDPERQKLIWSTFMTPPAS